MLIRYEVHRTGMSRIFKREFTRETETRFYYTMRNGKESWENKSGAHYFEDWQAAKNFLILKAECDIEEREAALERARERLIDLRGMTEEQVR